MAMTPKKQEPLLPAYLVVGEDALKRATVMKRLRARVALGGDLAFNSDIFSGDTASGSDIVSACNTLPFASEVRLVEVNSADKLGKVDAEALVDYLKAPSVSTVFALEAEKLAKNTRLYKAVASLGKNAVIDCAPLKRYELPKTVRSLAVNHGVTFTDGAAHKLIELVGENTIHLDNEIRKIALAHRGSDAVSEREVAALTARTAEVKPWEFVDAFSARDTATCILYFERMKSVSPHALLAMCINRIRELICARSFYERGTVSGVASALKQPDWRVKNHVKWACGFARSELSCALIYARDIEKAMKSGSDPHAAFLDWVLAVTTKK